MASYSRTVQYSRFFAFSHEYVCAYQCHDHLPRCSSDISQMADKSKNLSILVKAWTQRRLLNATKGFMGSSNNCCYNKLHSASVLKHVQMALVVHLLKSGNAHRWIPCTTACKPIVVRMDHVNYHIEREIDTSVCLNLHRRVTCLRDYY